tara:strand:+ start:9923 stop:10888 length:966 start_codon:yes stop_codon:yes gene_type:complete
MKISIIAPCYNAQNYIEQMILSVQEQTYENFELIIINDGSTDNSADIITKYKLKDCRIILIGQKNSGKPSIARNVGIKKATGDILCFLDSDDNMLPTKLQEVVSAFKDNLGIAVVAHDYYCIDAQGRKLGNSIISSNWDRTDMGSLFKRQSNYYLSVSNIYLYFLNNWIFLHVNTVSIKRDLFDSNILLFNEEMTFAEDISKWCDLLVNNKLLFIDKPLATYRDTPNSLMTNQLQADLAALYFFETHLFSPLITLDILTKKSLQRKINKELLDSLHLASAQGLSKTTFKLSMKLLKYSPLTPNILKIIKYNLSAILNKVIA